MTFLPGHAVFPVLGLAVLAAALFGASAATALEEEPGEKAAIEACDRRLCSILLQKDPKGGDLECSLTKTWTRAKIKKADRAEVQWGFGDARCSVDVNISREPLIAVITRDRFTFHAPRHTANCVVEQDGRPQKVTAFLAPKIEFRNGKADKVWVRLKKIKGPVAIRLTVQTAAQLADTFGLFHHQMIKGINRYIERHCPKTLAKASGGAPQKKGGK
jgi:hypothetical protein